MSVSRATSIAFIEPMLCLPVVALPEGDEWLYEVKWDGYRAIGTKDGSTCHLYSRNGKSFDRDFPDLLPELALLKCRSAVFDGEVVALTKDGLPSFQNLQKRSTRHVHLVAFDLLMLDGKDLRGKPLEWRRTKLENLLETSGTVRITLSPELDGHPDELLQKARALNLEGIVAKQRGSVYESGGRTGSWVKHRAELEGTFLIGGYEPGHQGFEELILGERKGRELHFVARLRNGFVPATRRKIMEIIKPHVQAACPFANLPEPGKSRWGQGLDAEAMSKCRWLKPKIAVQVAFLEWTEGRKLRHPRFLALQPT
jgi:bifunctional non-homologous end joining protein LigD